MPRRVNRKVPPPTLCRKCSGTGCENCEHGWVYPEDLKAQIDEIKRTRPDTARGAGSNKR